MDSAIANHETSFTRAWSHSRIRSRLSDTAVVINLCVSTRWIVLSMDDKTIHVFSSTGQPVKVLPSLPDNVWSLALRDDHLLSGDMSGKTSSWDLVAGECTGARTEHTRTVRCLEYIDSDIAISASGDATLKVWNLKDWSCTTTFSGHEKAIRAMVVTSGHIVSGSLDGKCRVWNLVEKRCTAILSGHNGPIYSITSDGSRVFSGAADNEVRVWDLLTGECRSILQSHTSLVSHIKVRDQLLVTAGADGRIVIWSLNDYSAANVISAAHQHAVTSLQVDDEYILSGGSDGSVALWDLRSGASLGYLMNEEDAVWKVAFGNGEQKTVIVASMNRHAHLDVGHVLP